MQFPTLYKTTSTGAMQYWNIEVIENEITTTYGQLNTKSPQITKDVITEGKSIGRANETTPEKQAEIEAFAKWRKQLKKGYIEDFNEAKLGVVNEIITGGVLPMLAHKFSAQGHKIKYPCYAQPKLDGMRCIAIIENGKCSLWSRTRKPILSVPHIIAALENRFKDDTITLDGELYNHAYKKDFEKIIHFARQETPIAGHEIVEYHIYDVILPRRFIERDTLLNLVLSKCTNPIIHVETGIITDEEALLKYFEKCILAGYEGVIVRNADGMYVNKRSYDLQKIKEFDDAEFQIVGINEGRGSLTGHVGSFICTTECGKFFQAKMSGDTAKLKEYFDNHSLWEGKHMTVKYQGLTAYGIPRFPVAVALRDYE